MEELIKRIEQDLDQAISRRNAFDVGSPAYQFNHGIVMALKTVLFDIKELKLK
jgi:hypothetical protein